MIHRFFLDKLQMAKDFGATRKYKLGYVVILIQANKKLQESHIVLIKKNVMWDLLILISTRNIIFILKIWFVSNKLDYSSFEIHNVLMHV